jgi:hypothetical protein
MKHYVFLAVKVNSTRAGGRQRLLGAAEEPFEDGDLVHDPLAGADVARGAAPRARRSRGRVSALTMPVWPHGQAILSII